MRSHQRVGRPQLRCGRPLRLPHRHAPAPPRRRRHVRLPPHRPDPLPRHRPQLDRSRLLPVQRPPSRYPPDRLPRHPGLTWPLRPHRPGRLPAHRRARPRLRPPARTVPWRRLPLPLPHGQPPPAVRPPGLPPPVLPSSPAVPVLPCGREQAPPPADPVRLCVRRPDGPSWLAVPSPAHLLVGPPGLRPLPPHPGRSVRAHRPPCGPPAAVARLVPAAVPPAAALERPPWNWWASRSDATAAAPRAPAPVPVPPGLGRRLAPEACPRACASRWRPAS